MAALNWVHQLDLDQDGNIYTGEVDTAKRIQKFVPRRHGGGPDDGH